jgi:thiosulfate/3-mercaptopyruvate sulfurtransferase
LQKSRVWKAQKRCRSSMHVV